MGRPVKVGTSLYLPGLQRDVRAEGSVSLGDGRPYWSRDPGVMLPGDDTEVEDIIIAVQENEEDTAATMVEFDSLSESDQGRVQDALAEAASTDLAERRAESAERSAEARRDARLDR